MKLKECTKEVCLRFRSWATWLSILGVVSFILHATGLYSKLNITDTMWEQGIMVLESLLVAFGIVNNPTDKEHF